MDDTAKRWRAHLVAGLMAGCLGFSCTGVLGSGADEGDRDGPSAPGEGDGALALGKAVMPRLTRAQYVNAVRDLFGAGIVVPELELDTRPGFFSVLGAADTSVSERGVSLYETAADRIAAQVFADEARRAALVVCEGGVSAEGACVDAFVRDFGRKAWRRPLTDIEVKRYRDLFTDTAGGEPWQGFQVVVMALLQSPNFIYRLELGAPDPDEPGRLRYDSHEIASRLSFLIRNSLPDEALRAAADSGELLTAEGIAKQATRLLEESPVPDGLWSFFEEYLELEKAGALHFPEGLSSPTLGDSMRLEVRALLAQLIEGGDDYRSLFTTRQTFVNEELAKIYGIPGITGTDLVSAVLPEGRSGLLSTGALLTIHSRDHRTSPTLRGAFVRTRIMCGSVPPPPANIPPLDNSITEQPQTLKEIIEAHMRNPQCRACHGLMDPIGLGMEDFDQFGRFRSKYDNGLSVDASSELDGAPFEGAAALGALLSEDTEVGTCIVKHLYRYGLAQMDVSEGAVEQLAGRFASSGYNIRELVLELVTSDGFRYAKQEEVDP